MRRSGLILFLLLCSLPIACEEFYYRSNAAGMLLERIAAWRRDEFEWVAGVEKSAGAEVRRLYAQGKESQRWEISAGGKGAAREERDFASGSLAARRLYDPTGSILSEETFRDGALLEKSVFTYSGPRLSRVRATGSDGSPLYTEEYLYATSGALREVRRAYAEGEIRQSRFFAGSSGLAEERNTVGSATAIARYDARGRVVQRERRDSDGLASREEFVFHPGSDALASSTENLPREKRLIRRQYDDKGLLAVETAAGPGNAKERVEYSRDENGRATSKRRQSAAGLEGWEYSYDANGHLAGEVYLLKGSRQKVTTYTAGGRVEEMYAEGELFLKVTWEGERRVKEEVFEAGAAVRERLLE
jgi:antitoxin component YwqK of YwqJK toxin-antitoxin module